LRNHSEESDDGEADSDELSRRSENPARKVAFYRYR